MDATVNDFLNEINEILPLAPPLKTAKHTCEWQECFDDGSGFPYYWNINTNKVTWEMPDEYKSWLQAGKRETSSRKPIFPVGCPVEVNAGIKTKSPPPLKDKVKESVRKVRRRSNSDSEDEKIVLISSYGGDTESESEGEDEEVKRINTASEEKNETPGEANTKSGGLSLVAGYSDSSEDEDDRVEKPVTPPAEPKVAHSTLFPVPQPIDINQFSEPKIEEEKPEEIDAKAFQRKRRIGVQLINVPRKPRIENNEVDVEDKNVKSYTNFVSAGISFVKSDSALPSTISKTESDDLNKSIEDEQSVLKEKLTFLSEAKEPASPVQIMLIQLDTLYAALKHGSLEPNYLTKWIKEMTEELVKLEAESTPKGWLLEWDRSQKRYYYRNEASDECQWEYPETNDDSMDICTTPPPTGVTQIVEEAPPKTPSPPPPPLITEESQEKIVPPPPPNVFIEQPLPPGVDPVEPKPKSDLNMALDSFYLDIAAIENKSSPAEVSREQPEVVHTNGDSLDTTEVTKKKKKVKLAAGIAMKKKGVSKMVEKWKNMQKELV